MKKIEMVDLATQHAKLQPELNDKIVEVVNSTQYIKGAEVKHFEKELAEYLNVSHTIGCANGTDALQIAMMALGLKPGDEVITANFTYVATAEIIALLQLKPVLVDVDPKTYCIDIEEVEKAITSKTKAIVPVHLFGQIANMEALLEISKKYNIAIVEDNAQAIGAEYTFSNGDKQMAGTIGDIGTTSFFPSKNLGCMGDGGAMFTNNEKLASNIRMIANHGQSKQYHHDVVGVNSRLDSIQAAVLRIKLRNLDNYCKARKAAADYYTRHFKESKKLVTPFISDSSTHVFHQYVLQAKGFERDKLRAFLTEHGIPSNIYYPIPLNEQKAYSSSINNRAFPVTEELCKTVFALPIHTEFEKEQQDFIIKKVNEFIANS